GALAPRAADVAVAAAAADVARDRQFVVGVGAEQRRLHVRAAVAAPLGAEFEVAAGRWREVERQPGAAVGAVAQFVEGGRLEAAPRRDIHAPVLRRSEEHTSELQSRENLVCRLLLEKKN